MRDNSRSNNNRATTDAGLSARIANLHNRSIVAIVTRTWSTSIGSGLEGRPTLRRSEPL